MFLNAFPAVLACSLVMTSRPLEAQDFPEGSGKQIVTAVCGGCHDINRIRIGYTPEGWRTVIRMMQNVETPVPTDQWATVAEYLTKNFPERQRPSRGRSRIRRSGDQDVACATPGSRPHDPLATRDRAIWWTGQLANTLGRLDPRNRDGDPVLANSLTNEVGLVEVK